MRTFLVVAATGLLVLAGQTLATTAQAAERYETFALAEALDEKCGYLPYIEHQVLRDLTTKAVELSNLSSTSRKMGDDGVYKFYQAQKAKADATACTPENGNSLVGPVRGDILTELGLEAALTVQYDEKAKAPVTWGTSLLSLNAPHPSADDLAAAQVVENYLAQLWGANAEANFRYLVQTAAKRIQDDPDGTKFEFSSALYGVDYQVRAEHDKALLTAGPSPWQRIKSNDGKIALSQRSGTFGTGYSGFVYLIVRDGAVYASAHERQKGAIAGQTGLRIYVRKPAAPTRKDNLPLTWDNSWRSQARAFDMKPTTQTAFGGTLYLMPADAVAALQSLNDDDTVEIAIVQGAEDQAGNNGSSRCDFDIGPIKTALKP